LKLTGPYLQYYSYDIVLTDDVKCYLFLNILYMMYGSKTNANTSLFLLVYVNK